MPGESTILGYGLITPFRRGANDFVSGGGVEVVRSAVRTILGCVCAGPDTQGEFRFNQRLGTLLPHVRHSNLDDATTSELVRYYVVDALAQNEPRVRVRRFRVVRNRPAMKLTIKVVYDVIDRDVPGNRVLATGLEDEVTV
jgi:phage baseplate assembly protein W